MFWRSLANARIGGARYIGSTGRRIAAPVGRRPFVPVSWNERHFPFFCYRNR
jgi:hypothetical protein